MSEKKKYKYQRLQPTSQIFFTLSVVRILKEAISTFERMLLQKPDGLPNVPFAQEIVEGLKTKLDDMLQLEEWEKETPFDYNEVLILYAAVRLYLIELKFSHKEDLFIPCVALYQRLSMIVEHIRMNQLEWEQK